jgi:type I restriction enzyme R subunit
MTQFAFLQAEWPLSYEAAHQAEGVVLSDPRTACFQARRALELMVKWLYRHDTSLRSPYQTHLNALLFEGTFKDLVGPKLLAKAKIIKDLGNQAVHTGRPVRLEDAVVAVRELFHIGFWLARTYARKSRPSDDLTFDAALLPRTSAQAPQALPQLQAMEDELAKKDEALALAEKGRSDLEAELEALRRLVTQAKAENQAVPDRHDYSEAATRTYFIDLLLKEVGWPLDQGRDREFEVLGMPNAEGMGYVDYVLWGDDGKPLGLVEAKRTTKSPHEGKQQAKLYADCLEARFGQRPVIFLSNGYEHWIWDDASYPSRPVQGFFNKAELELLIQRRTTRQSLATATIDPSIVERAYQHRAIRRIGETFEKENQRKALVVMATGAGKTRTVIALSDLLMRCNWIKRVLFLADRVALVNQAVGAFKKHLPAANPVNLVTEKNQDGRIFVSTYPTMMGLIDDLKDGQRRFGPGHFDLIVIDEAHRSVYQKYRAIFSYFDSLLVGLTATPKDEIDKNTYSLFDLETGVPTDIYGLDEAVRDGYLVPPKGISVPLKFPRDGITYDELSEEEKEEWDALDWEEGEAPDRVDPASVNRWLFNADTVDKALELLMTQGLKVEGGDRLGKTIIFAKTHDHAEFIAARFDKAYPHYKGHFGRVIDFKVTYAQSLIDDFSKKDKAPHIAISVDMLDTGIDVPEVVNLVFFKPVRSRTKFWQMVGRGTRLCPDLFGPGQPKQCFYIFDLCQNLEFFSQDIKTPEGKAAPSLGKRLFRARTELVLALDKALGSRVGEGGAPEWALRDGTAGLLRDQVAGMSPDNFLVRPHRKLVEDYSQAQAWQTLTSVDAPGMVDALGDLPTSATEQDEEAKRFDLLVLRLQLAVLRQEDTFAALADQMKALAGALSEMGNIPMVAAVMPLILDLASDLWWEGATLPMLEQVRLKLRGLVKLIERVQKKILYTDFEDELGVPQEVDLGGFTAGTDPEKFKAKVRQFLLEHESHFAIQRLRTNQPLTVMDLAELERMLAEAGLGAPDQLTKAKEECHGLGLFIRSLVGLDREAAKAAFNGFVNGRNLNASQLEFIDMMIDRLTHHGVMDPGLLYESPFTDLNSLGIEGVFQQAEVQELVRILEDVESHAVA